MEEISTNTLSPGTVILSCMLTCTTFFCFTFATIQAQHIPMFPGITFRFRPLTISLVASLFACPNLSCTSFILHGFLVATQGMSSYLFVLFIYRQTLIPLPCIVAMLSLAWTMHCAMTLLVANIAHSSKCVQYNLCFLGTGNTNYFVPSSLPSYLHHVCL